VREVSAEEYLLPSGCATFPARDLLAPLAAAMSDWLTFEQCGEVTSNYVKLDWPETRADKGGKKKITGEIVYVDAFGNAVTSISPRELADVCDRDRNTVCLFIGEDGNGKKVRSSPIPVKSHYNDVPKGDAVAYAGSAGLMEVGVSGGNAAEILGIGAGSRVCFERK
jgi:S-adenosylmethionine hydrolase